MEEEKHAKHDHEHQHVHRKGKLKELVLDDHDHNHEQEGPYTLDDDTFHLIFYSLCDTPPKHISRRLEKGSAVKLFESK